MNLLAQLLYDLNGHGIQRSVLTNNEVAALSTKRYNQGLLAGFWLGVLVSFIFGMFLCLTSLGSKPSAGPQPSSVGSVIRSLESQAVIPLETSTTPSSTSR